jgi:hypothetical protein
MSTARFAIQSVGEITRRGRVVIGDLLEGSVKAGMRATVEGRQDSWLIGAVESADNPSRHEHHIGLVFTDAPPLAQLREILMPGCILVITDQGSA